MRGAIVACRDVIPNARWKNSARTADVGRAESDRPLPPHDVVSCLPEGVRNEDIRAQRSKHHGGTAGQEVIRLLRRRRNRRLGSAVRPAGSHRLIHGPAIRSLSLVQLFFSSSGGAQIHDGGMVPAVGRAGPVFFRNAGCVLAVDPSRAPAQESLSAAYGRGRTSESARRIHAYPPGSRPCSAIVRAAAIRKAFALRPGLGLARPEQVQQVVHGRGWLCRPRYWSH